MKHQIIYFRFIISIHEQIFKPKLIEDQLCELYYNQRSVYF